MGAIPDERMTELLTLDLAQLGLSPMKPGGKTVTLILQPCPDRSAAPLAFTGAPSWTALFEAEGYPTTEIPMNGAAFKEHGLNRLGRSYCVLDVDHPAFRAEVPEEHVEAVTLMARVVWDFDVAGTREEVLALDLVCWEQYRYDEHTDAHCDTWTGRLLSIARTAAEARAAAAAAAEAALVPPPSRTARLLSLAFALLQTAARSFGKIGKNESATELASTPA